MISFFSRHRKPIFIGTVAVFLVGVFVGLGAYMFTGDASGAVADVGGRKITYQRFSTQVNRVLNDLRDDGTDIGDMVRRGVEQEVFRELVIEELMRMQAEELGMSVSDFELSAEIQSTPAFRDGGAFSPRLYYQAIWNEFRMAPSEYEDWRRKARLASKYKQFLFTSIKITPEELRAYYLSRQKDFKSFEKDKGRIMQELQQEKFMQVANYHLRQLTVRIEIKNYLDRIQQQRPA
ncbi:MAG TPA: SurA N-terminal domain-containing protein [Elusimicrobiales bacterium]|nr:SurA N-terminal domain-containing protein [Elusimicrobiales bacterium]